MVATIMQTTTTVLTTVAAMSTTLASNYISSQASSSTSVTTVTTIATSIRSTPSNLLFSNVAAQPKSSSASTIGLSIGLPIGIFCFGLLILLCYFYLKRNSVSISNPPMSATIPREEEYCRRTNWFSRYFGRVSVRIRIHILIVILRSITTPSGPRVITCLQKYSTKFPNP